MVAGLRAASDMKWSLGNAREPSCAIRGHHFQHGFSRQSDGIRHASSSGGIVACRCKWASPGIVENRYVLMNEFGIWAFAGTGIKAGPVSAHALFLVRECLADSAMRFLVWPSLFAILCFRAVIKSTTGARRVVFSCLGAAVPFSLFSISFLTRS